MGQAGAQRRPSGDPIAQQRHAERVGYRIVVAFDHLEIVGDQEVRSGGTGGRQQRRFAVTRQGLAIGTAETGIDPGGERPHRLAVAGRGVGRDDFVAPGLASDPAVFLEEKGRRTERVRDVAPDVLASVPVEVDGVAFEGRWHELRLAHRTGPGSLHRLGRDMTLLQDVERIEQFLAEIVAAIARVGEGREAADGREVARVLAEIGLEAPDAEDDVGVDAEAGIGFLEGRLPVARLALPGFDPAHGHGAGEIVRRALGEFRLAMRLGEHGRVRCHVGEGSIERVAAGPHACAPATRARRRSRGSRLGKPLSAAWPRCAIAMSNARPRTQRASVRFNCPASMAGRRLRSSSVVNVSVAKV